MYKRRIKIFLAVILAAFLAVAGRLWWLQVVTGTQCRDAAEEALRAPHPIETRRGRIEDREGEVLALDRPCYELCLDYRFMTADAHWLSRQHRRIAREQNVSAAQSERLFEERAGNTWELACRYGQVSREQLDETVQRIVRRVEAIRAMVGMEVLEEREMHPVLAGLDDRAAAELKAHLPQMVGAEVRPGFVRYYPHGDLACHVIGTIGQVTREEQRRLNLPATADRAARMQQDYLDGDLIGKTGVELACEAALRGRRGYVRLQRTVGEAEVLEHRPGEPGGTVRLSLDHGLQRRLAELFLRMTAEANLSESAREGDAPGRGAIVVLSLPHREVLALVSVPTYDLNSWRGDFATLLHDHHLPMRNRAVSVLYPPGSTAKPIAALAALNTDKPRCRISGTHEFDCRGMKQVGARLYLHCWTVARGMDPHGRLSVVPAIQHSCNVFFYEVGGMLGIEDLSRWFERFGFAEPAGTILPEDVSGTVPTSDWLRASRPGYRPVPVDAMQIAIGQGFLGATPAHVANAMATISQGGRWAPARLVLEGGSPVMPERALPVSPASVRLVVEGMRKVVNEQGGTAYKYFHGPDVVPVRADVYGKTGTATAIPGDLNGDGVVDSYERSRNEMAWFAGFALGEHSRGRAVEQRSGVAIAVVVEHVTGGGGKNAAPIAREAIRICQEMGYVP